MALIEEVIRRFPKRSTDCNKSDLGHVMVIAGSCGYTGAAYLASQAALVSGSGLITLAVGKSIYPIMSSKLTEVMVKPFVETKDYSLSLLAEKDLLTFSEKCNSFVFGPGISRNRETQQLIRQLVEKIDKPIVLDADGINAFLGHQKSLKSETKKIVMTPHTGELARFLGKEPADIESNRKDVALNFANEYNTVLVLKGHRTIVADPGGEYYINETGNSGMASGGTGDVLTGMIAGFIAQGADLFGAAVLGAYFHGLAGDAVLEKKSILSLTASDILEALPIVLKKLA